MVNGPDAWPEITGRLSRHTRGMESMEKRIFFAAEGFS
jgi:hypothetical protein